MLSFFIHPTCHTSSLFQSYIPSTIETQVLFISALYEIGWFRVGWMIRRLLGAGEEVGWDMVLTRHHRMLVFEILVRLGRG